MAKTIEQTLKDYMGELIFQNIVLTQKLSEAKETEEAKKGVIDGKSKS